MFKGKFIVLEGIDGCGKTTIAKLLAVKLRKAGNTVLVTKEPTRTTVAGKKIYQILQHQISAPSPLDFQKLYIADRLEHTQKTIEPAIAQGTVVICQRYALSTFAYGMAFRVPRDKLEHEFLEPDMTFFLKLSVMDAMERIRSRDQGTEYFEKRERLRKISSAYNTLVQQKNFGPIVVLEAVFSPHVLISQICALLASGR